MTETRLLYIFTRTPLHVGAGASVGAIDQPIMRERHTGFPIIPGSTLKGVFADEWTEVIEVTRDDPTRPGQTITAREARPKPDRDWLFGKGGGTEFNAGALQFGEARLLAFPVRSARGSFAWITCPLLLARAARDGALDKARIPPQVDRLTDEQALFLPDGPLALAVGQPPKTQVVLEEYVFTLPRSLSPTPADATRENDATDQGLQSLAEQGLMPILPDDDVWKEITARLVVVSNGMMSFFTTNACEVAQHVRIEDATGTADAGGLFNQENVPSEALFYALVYAASEAGKQLKEADGRSRPARPPLEAITRFWPDANKTRLCQFGADASTGLGYCSVRLKAPPAPPPGGGQHNEPNSRPEPGEAPSSSGPTTR